MDYSSKSETIIFHIQTEGTAPLPNPSVKKDADNIRKVLCKSFIRWFWELYLCCYTEYWVDCFGSLRLFFCCCWSETLNVRSLRKQLVLFSQESWCFPRRSRGKHQDSRENKTNWFPEGPDIKCFVIFLDFHFNVLQQQQKNTLKRSESKQYDSVLIRTQI